MRVPNGFKSSQAARQIQYDEEGRMRDVNVSRQSTGSVGDANSLYATEAEKFGTVAPFLKANMNKDATRRNYVIQPGGAAIYFDGPAHHEDDRERAEFHDQRESFGHNSLDGSKMVTGGRSFAVGDRGNVNS